MNPDSVYQRLCELSWRRPLTAAEQAELRAWLVVHPEAQAEAETELALNQALVRLPDAPMPSNFTARLWQTIEQTEVMPEQRSTVSSSRWWRMIPRFAMATVVIVAGLLVYRHHEAEQQVALVQSLLVVATPSLADPKVIADFDVIRQLSPTTAADEELLSLMQ